MTAPSFPTHRQSWSIAPAIWFINVLLLVALLPSAHGAVKTWTGSAGAGNGNFNVSGNWFPSGAPAAGDDLIFQTGVTQLLVTNDFSPNRAFNSLLFQGSNYFVRGNAILVTNGINSSNPVGANHIDADVDVRAAQFWEAQGPLASLDINGDINLNANLLTVRANTGDFFFSGVISGTGGINKTNVGTLRLDGGGGHNTYSGTTIFGGGVLELSKFSIFPFFTNFTAIVGDLIIGDGNGLVGTDVLRLLTDDQIANTSDVTVKNSGRFDLNDNSDRIASLTMKGGAIETGTGLITLGGNVTSLGDSETATIDGNLSLGGATRTFDISAGAAAPDMEINAVISPGTSGFSTAGIIKNGPGTLEFGGTNTYNGTTTINDGQLAITADRGLGVATTIFGGSAGTVINGDANLFLSNVQVTNEALTINAINSAGDFNVSGASVWTGDILLNSDTFLGGSGNLLLNGEISGAGGFTKIGSGSVTLGGTNANIYTGTTTVKDGTLILDKDTLEVIDGAMSGPLIIGEDELPENTDVVRYLHCCQLPDDTDVTINASGLLDLNGFGDNVRNIIFNGGDVDAPSPGSILPVGDITVNANANSQAIISGRMSVLSNPIINVTGHNFSPDLIIDAQLFGAGGFTKNGVGEVSLTAANTYTGQTTVNDGLLIVRDSLALGTTAGGTVVNSGAVLDLESGVAIGAEALTLAGTGQGSFGALNSIAGSNSWAGNITLSGNATISVDLGDFLNLSGSINGAFDITKTASGTLIFSGGTASSFDEMFVNAGTLVLDKTIANAAGFAELTIGDNSGTDILRLARDNQILDTAQVHLTGTAARLDVNDQTEATGAISGNGIIDLGVGTLRPGADNNSSLFSGTIIGTGSLFKLGTGAWTLTGNNTYTGQTTVSAGTLVVNGSQQQSPVTVNGTATLMGSGVIGNLQVFGSVAPGSSAGILTSSNVAFTSQGDYFVELGGPAPGTGYDQLNVRGTNQLGSSTLHVSLLPGFAPFEGEAFVIINNDGSEAIQGTFTGLPNGTVFTAGGLQFRILYSDIFLNDVVLLATNTAARLVSATVTSGNGDGDVDVNECNLISVVVTNVSGGTLTGVEGTLIPKTAGVSVTVGTADYPNMAAGARGTNTTPFQFSTGPGFVCGTNLDFDLVLHTDANGTFTIPFTLPSGSAGSTLRFNNNSVTSIPDNGSVDSLITVAGITTPIKRVTVSLHITHAADSHLDISLVAPDGTIVNLSSDNGGASANYGTDCTDANRTTFSDSGLTAITAASAPFVGTFRPEESLSAFSEKSGTTVNGTWRLRIADDTAGTAGSLQCWSLFISPTACTDGGGACESCPQGRVISGILGTGSLVQTNRLSRDGNPSTCGPQKACPGPTGALGNRAYDAYVFENGDSNACIAVNLQSPCGTALFSAAYTNAYNPASLCQNHLADAGSSSPSTSYSFRVGPRARFVIVVNAVDPGNGCEYTLTVNGGSCRPVLKIDPLAGNKVALDWSTAAVGYNLLQTNRLPLAPNPNWIPATPAPLIFNSRFRVTNTMNPSNSFYELRKP
jgi:autotransporter-associated beta strand protein